jgi:type I restriction enzyme M protein
VLFIQTWNEDPKSPSYNPKLDDYEVFLATSHNSGKNSSGEYVYRIGQDNAPLLDSHGHMIVEHDLDEIADAFRNWGRIQGLSFCKEPA